MLSSGERCFNYYNIAFSDICSSVHVNGIIVLANIIGSQVKRKGMDNQ